MVIPLDLTRWPRLLVAATQGVPFVHASPTRPEVGSGKVDFIWLSAVGALEQSKNVNYEPIIRGHKNEIFDWDLV